MKITPIAIALALLTTAAQAGEVKVTLTGSVSSNSYSSGPLASVMVNDTVTWSCTVNTPGVDVAPGQLTNYSVNLATFQMDAGGPTGFVLAGPSTVQVQNAFPVSDGFRMMTPGFTSGEMFSAGFGAIAAFFTSTDLEMLYGTYDVSTQLTSFNYIIAGGGGFFEVFPETLVIEPGPVGTIFCDPAVANSTGVPAEIQAGLTAPGGGLHLEVTNGPASQFAYFLVGTAALDPGTPLSLGNLCLSAVGGNSIGRYNATGSNRNSTGMFDAAGTLQNVVGTSSVGSGFDVPNALPLPGLPTIMTGETWHFQLWYRDTGGSNFSSGVSVTF